MSERSPGSVGDDERAGEHRRGAAFEDGTASIRSALLEWYDEHRRDLPWRSAAGESPDPYRIWLSEVMLQQTRVETVRGYFHRWMERFPTLRSLADAPVDEVLRTWEGLGYYSRARNLHRAVREVAARYDGRVPDDPEAFRALPGVGRYTAGAVMSIAFGRAEPIVDGNVRRVFARLADTAEPADADLWRMAAGLVPGDRPGDLNQAIMELGATVCTPRSPRCEACPVASWCVARAAGTEAERPARRRKREVPRERVAAAVVERDGAWLLARRVAAGRLGGMWEFPGIPCADGEPAEVAAQRGLVSSFGLHVRECSAIASVEHVFTHVRVTYEVVRCVAKPGARAEPVAGGTWDAAAFVPPAGLHTYALPVAQRKIAALVASAGTEGAG